MKYFFVLFAIFGWALFLFPVLFVGPPPNQNVPHNSSVFTMGEVVQVPPVEDPQRPQTKKQRTEHPAH